MHCSLCCVLQYFSLLLIAFTGLVASTALAYVYRGKITDSLHGILKKGLNKYDNDTGCQEAIDLMQSEVSFVAIIVLYRVHQKWRASTQKGVLHIIV